MLFPRLSRRVPLLAAITALCLLLAPAGVSSAHEFIVMPKAQPKYESGKALPLSVYSTHIFVKGEELEPAELTELSYGGSKVALKADEAALTYNGALSLKGGGAAIIEGHRLPVLYSELPDGEGEGGRRKYPNAISSSRYEKFAKLLLPVDGQSKGFDKKIGHRLEIVPVDNPLAAKPGDEIRVKVFLDGKPAAFDMIKATYDGFTEIPAAWAFAASPTAHGEAKVRISAKGIWIIQVGVIVDKKTDDYDNENLKAILIFPVQ